jgi:hypothetical protein
MSNRPPQLDLFGWKRPARLRSHHPPVGLLVRLDRPADRKHPCCDNIAIVSAPYDTRGSELWCAGCHRHRGWASKQTADRAYEIHERFNVTPIIN